MCGSFLFHFGIHHHTFPYDSDGMKFYQLLEIGLSNIARGRINSCFSVIL